MNNLKASPPADGSIEKEDKKEQISLEAYYEYPQSLKKSAYKDPRETKSELHSTITEIL
jgi:hypothetical protein